MTIDPKYQEESRRACFCYHCQQDLDGYLPAEEQCGIAQRIVAALQKAADDENEACALLVTPLDIPTEREADMFDEIQRAIRDRARGRKG